MTVQEAVDAPRFHQQWLPNPTQLEPFALSPDTRRILEGMGHVFARVAAGQPRRRDPGRRAGPRRPAGRPATASTAPTIRAATAAWRSATERRRRLRRLLRALSGGLLRRRLPRRALLRRRLLRGRLLGRRLLRRAFLAGTLPPSLRASERPIAIACFLLVTFLPEPPLFSVPAFFSCIAFSTLSPAFLPYVAMCVPRLVVERV